MGEWMKEHGVDAILGVLGFVGFAGVMKFYEEVRELWRDHPWPLAFCCLLAFALGTWFYYSQGRKEAYVERKREERARRYAEVDAAEKRRLDEEAASRDKAERARRLILGLEPWLKSYLHHLRSEGGSVAIQSVSDRAILEELYPIHELLEMTRVSGEGDIHDWRVSLNDYGTYVVETCADLLDEAVAHERKDEE